jgi:hypothetical protein
MDPLVNVIRLPQLIHTPARGIGHTALIVCFTLNPGLNPGLNPDLNRHTMKIFIPITDEQLETMLPNELPVPFQPGCVTLSQLSPTQPPQAAHSRSSSKGSPTDTPSCCAFPALSSNT